MDRSSAKDPLFGERVISDEHVSTEMGAYGEVRRATLGGFACAAKTFYCSDSNKKERVKIEFELQALNVFQHPNLVQCFTTAWCVEKERPILLMELLDESLLHFLNRKDSSIPYHLKVDLCKDIALAIKFLHLNEIVHGNLTGNNVLILKEVRAKVTDYWMTIIHRHGEKTDCTELPEKVSYMAPERMKDPQNVSVKSDSFSYGVIVSYIDTHSAPIPQKIVRPEQSPFTEIACQCLSEEPDRRPIFDDICMHLENLIDSNYVASAEEAKISGAEVIQSQLEKQLQDTNVKQTELQSMLKRMYDKVNHLQRDNDSLRIKLTENSKVMESCLEESGQTESPQDSDIIIPVDQVQISEVIIGQGESATVYKGHWKSNPIAFKILSHHQNGPEKWMTHFYHEASVLSQLSHPNIVKILGISTSPGCVGIIVELMTSTLQDMLFGPDQMKSISIRKKNRIIRSIGLGLEYLHSHDVHHGRLSASNVHISGDNIYKVANFGPKLSQINFTSYHIIEDKSESCFYSAPEVLRKDIMSIKHFTKADMYSLAMVVYEVLSQRHCFDKTMEKQQLVGMVVQYDARPNLDTLQGIADVTKDLLVKCWDKDPLVRMIAKDFAAKWNNDCTILSP